MQFPTTNFLFPTVLGRLSRGILLVGIFPVTVVSVPYSFVLALAHLGLTPPLPVSAIAMGLFSVFSGFANLFYGTCVIVSILVTLIRRAPRQEKHARSEPPALGSGLPLVVIA